MMRITFTLFVLLWLFACGHKTDLKLPESEQERQSLKGETLG
jgi:predicted small lipoprotein YifL